MLVVIKDLVILIYLVKKEKLMFTHVAMKVTPWI